MTVLRFLLFPISLLFGAVAVIRNWSFDLGLRRSRRLEKPVISVGNLAMGGSGKTPVVIELCRMFGEAGLRVAVLSRGYGRREPGSVRLVDPEGDWRDFGDEPLMIARRCPGARVCVGPSRFEAARALGDWAPDLYLVDDGYQHRQLTRDLNLLLINLQQPMPRVFPMGMFREGWGAVKRADAVLLTRWDGILDTEHWERKIRALHPRVPILRLGMKPSCLAPLSGGRNADLARLRGRRIGAFCGIAGPRSFLAALKELGAGLQAVETLRDHEPMSGDRLEGFLDRCRNSGVGWVVTTEKDAVKLDKTRDFDILLYSLLIDVSWEHKNKIRAILDPFLPKEFE